MLLSNTQILRHLRETKAIVIHPYNPEALGNVSYDLSLGDTIARYLPSGAIFEPDIHDPSELFRLEKAGESGGFLLRAGERVLAHSREIAGGLDAWCAKCSGRGDQQPMSADKCSGCFGKPHVAVTTQLHTTSTAARIGIDTHCGAGFGDVGFTSPWVFEITNMSPRALHLPVGAVLAQVSFSEVSPILEGTSYESRGRYQNAACADPAETMRNWRLKDGLPKRLKVRA